MTYSIHMPVIHQKQKYIKSTPMTGVTSTS